MATVSRSQFPDSVVPEKGKQIRVANQLGQTFVMTIIDVTDGSVTLDANHPAGRKGFDFEIDLVQIN